MNFSGGLPSRMLPSNKKRRDFINMLCRICAREELNSIPIFGDDAKKQNLVKKIQACLPVNICETDALPKRICLTCLTKLDSFWDMHVLCKEAQIKIEERLSFLRNQENLEQIRIALPVEEKLKGLSASYPVSYGDSAVICLAPDSSPPPHPVTATTTREAQVLPQAGPVEPVTYLAPAPAVSAPAPPPVTEEVYPQALIQVPQSPASEQHVVYQNPTAPAAAPAPPAVPRRRAPVSVPKPMASPTPATTTQRSNPAPLKRQNGETSNGPDAKKLCIYCNKYFTDDIIDHHVSLHLRQSFSSCVECGKNFRSEEAMQRHRCGEKKDNETINLDADDDEPIIL